MSQASRGSRQGRLQRTRTRHRAEAGRQRRIREARGAAGSEGSSAGGAGTLDAESALQAVRELGIPVDHHGNIDTDTDAARRFAEGAAEAAAAALGVELRRSDGGIDPARAGDVLRQVLGFSIGRDGRPEQRAAAGRAEKAAEEAVASILRTARALGLDTGGLEAVSRNANGRLDTETAARIAQIALNLQVAEQRRSGRQEAFDALNSNLDGLTSDRPASRREASDAVDRLLSRTIDPDGRITRPGSPVPPAGP